MEFGSEWAYLNAEDDIESVEEEESSSDEEFAAVAPKISVRRRRGAPVASGALKTKGKKKKWRLQPQGEQDDGKVTWLS